METRMSSWKSLLLPPYPTESQIPWLTEFMLCWWKSRRPRARGSMLSLFLKCLVKELGVGYDALCGD